MKRTLYTMIHDHLFACPEHATKYRLYDDPEEAWNISDTYEKRWILRRSRLFSWNEIEKLQHHMRIPKKLLQAYKFYKRYGGWNSLKRKEYQIYHV